MGEIYVLTSHLGRTVIDAWRKKVRGDRVKNEGDKRWNIYHVLPLILTLFFVIIYDVMIYFDTTITTNKALSH